MNNKSTPEEIRERFDNDVERFSNLETAQATTIDALLVIELVAQAAAACNPDAKHVLDIGCGAGNYTLKLLQYVPVIQATLVDLSKPMLDRAVDRIRKQTEAAITPLQGDIRTLDIGQDKYDIVLAAASLHHLREEKEWHSVFSGIYAGLKPGGSFWIADLVDHDIQPVRELMKKRYGDYLVNLQDRSFRDQVFAYVEKEDTPRSVDFQLSVMKQAGFSKVDILHKNSVFAAFGAIK